MTDGKKGTILNWDNRTKVRKRVGLAAEIFDRYGDEIRAIIHFNVKDKSRAEDIFQNAEIAFRNTPNAASIL